MFNKIINCLFETDNYMDIVQYNMNNKEEKKS